MRPLLKVQKLPPSLIQTSQFHSTTARNATPFFQLAALSHARETQHFAKRSGLSVVEHVPKLQEIRSSEVTPFASKSGSNAGKTGEKKESLQKEETTLRPVQPSQGGAKSLSGRGTNVINDDAGSSSDGQFESSDDMLKAVARETFRRHKREVEGLKASLKEAQTALKETEESAERKGKTWKEEEHNLRSALEGRKASEAGEQGTITFLLCSNILLGVLWWNGAGSSGPTKPAEGANTTWECQKTDSGESSGGDNDAFSLLSTLLTPAKTEPAKPDKPYWSSWLWV